MPVTIKKQAWTTRPLHELCDIFKGISPSYVVECNATTVINQKCIRNYSIDYNFIKYHDENRKKVPVKKFLQPGDILLNSTGVGTLGRTAIITQLSQPCIVDSHITVLRAMMAVYPQFLGYQLLCRQKELESFASGSTGQAELSRACLNEMSIMLPSLSEQKKIVDILKSLDDKIELNNKINANLEAQAQAIFKSWFVDFEPFRDGEFIDSELGRIPKGWKVEKLDTLLEIKYGKDHKKLSHGRIPVYGSGGLMRHVDRPLYEKESVLIPRKGTLHNIMYVNHSFWTVDTMFFTIMKKLYLAKYIYLYLQRLDLASMNSGSAVPSMTAAILNGTSILVPCNNILKRFDLLASAVFSSIERCQRENATLKSVRDVLLPKLMSGEIKV